MSCINGAIAFLEELKKTQTGAYAQMYLDEAIDALKTRAVREAIETFQRKVKFEPRKPQVGDIIETLEEYDYNGHQLFPVGTIGVITKILDLNDPLPYEIYNKDGDYWYYDSTMFKVVKERGNNNE